MWKTRQHHLLFLHNSSVYAGPLCCNIQGLYAAAGAPITASVMSAASRVSICKRGILVCSSFMEFFSILAYKSVYLEPICYAK
ncbi:hypothetical protein D7Y41_30605 [Anaerotruncus sp. 1XD22-93]|nr:hypothetical protein D7Y41_30605 [Anaerotruncus sp. 1XD22-93]